MFSSRARRPLFTGRRNTFFFVFVSKDYDLICDRFAVSEIAIFIPLKFYGRFTFVLFFLSCSPWNLNVIFVCLSDSKSMLSFGALTFHFKKWFRTFWKKLLFLKIRKPKHIDCIAASDWSQSSDQFHRIIRWQWHSFDQTVATPSPCIEEQESNGARIKKKEPRPTNAFNVQCN